MAGRKKSMLELTGRGDDGTTGLLGGGRVSKTDERIEAYGTVDEASSALGLAKGLTADSRVRELCEQLQRDLYRLGAELATAPGKEGSFGAMTQSDVERLNAMLGELEAEAPMPEGFILPGQTAASGALDLARTIVRRAERRWLRLAEPPPGAPGQSQPALPATAAPEAARPAANANVGGYLNRLSLVLFALGRFEEGRAGLTATLAKSGGTVPGGSSR